MGDVRPLYVNVVRGKGQQPSVIPVQYEEDMTLGHLRRMVLEVSGFGGEDEFVFEGALRGDYERTLADCGVKAGSMTLNLVQKQSVADAFVLAIHYDEKQESGVISARFQLRCAANETLQSVKRRACEKRRIPDVDRYELTFVDVDLKCDERTIVADLTCSDIKLARIVPPEPQPFPSAYLSHPYLDRVCGQNVYPETETFKFRVVHSERIPTECSLDDLVIYALDSTPVDFRTWANLAYTAGYITAAPSLLDFMVSLFDGKCDDIQFQNEQNVIALRAISFLVFWVECDPNIFSLPEMQGPLMDFVLRIEDNPQPLPIRLAKWRLLRACKGTFLTRDKLSNIRDFLITDPMVPASRGSDPADDSVVLSGANFCRWATETYGISSFHIEKLGEELLKSAMVMSSCMDGKVSPHDQIVYPGMRNSFVMFLTDMPGTDFTEQMTLFLFDIFRQIPVTIELVNLSWLAFDKSNKAPFTTKYLTACRSLKLLLVHEIVGISSLKKRQETLRFLIERAVEAYTCNSFQVSRIVCEVLMHPAIGSLRQTWMGVSPNRREDIINIIRSVYAPGQANYVRQVASLLDPLKAHQCSYISSFSNKNMALFSPMRDLNDELHTLQTGKQPNYIERLAKPVPALPILEVHLSHLGCIQNVPQYYEDGLTLNAWMMSLLGNELEDLTLMQRAAFNYSHILMHQRALAYACSFQVNEQDLMSTARTREPQALPYNGEMKQFIENLQKLDYDSS